MMPCVVNLTVKISSIKFSRLSPQNLAEKKQKVSHERDKRFLQAEKHLQALKILK
jgi:hypothetical protein